MKSRQQQRTLGARIAIATLIVLWSAVSLNPGWCETEPEQSSDPGVLRAQAQEAAQTFINRFSASPGKHIQSIRFSYEVHMDLDAFVRTTMDVTLQMVNEGDHYTSLFNLAEPQGKDVWSRFALFVYGRRTEDYRILKTRVDTTIQETFFHGSNGFLTQELKEVLPEQKDYENQTGIRILFDYQRNVVDFWEDQNRKEPSRTISYEGQTGPLAAFFNFVLFKEPRTTFTIINALKRTEKVVVSEGTKSIQKKIIFLFSNDRVRLQANTTGRHTDFSNAVYFESPNYLDLIYGQNIYYDIVHNETSNAKIPYSVLLEGLISKAKQREKERRLKELTERPMGHDALQERLQAIEQMNVLAARNVRVYLKEAEVAWR